MFELWTDKKVLLSNLSLTESLAAFLHLSFVTQLKYPQVKYCHNRFMILTALCRKQKRYVISFSADLQLMEMTLVSS